MNKKIRQNRFRTDTAELRKSKFAFTDGFKLFLKFTFFAVLIISSSLLFIFIHDFITQTKYFSLKKIVVSPCKRLSKDEIIKQSGISLGENIFAINLFKVKKRLISHEWIKDASIERKLPSEIIINIREQHPLAVVMVGSHHALLINDTGQPFTDCNRVNAHLYNKSDEFMRFSVITGLSLVNKKGCFCFSGKLFDSVMGFLSGAYTIGNKTILSNIIRQIKVDRDIGLDVQLVDCLGIGIRNNGDKKISQELNGANCILNLKMGFGNYEERLRKLECIIDYLKRKNINRRISAVDLTNLNNISVKFQENETGGNLPDSIKGGV